MAELTLRVHEIVDDKDGNPPRLVGVHHYVRLAREGGIAVFIQGGQFFGAGGAQIPDEDIPDWVWEDVEKLAPKARAACGLGQSALKSKEKRVGKEG
jgi:hypothetical protein